MDDVRVEFDKDVVERAMSYCLSRQFGVPVSFRLVLKPEKNISSGEAKK